MLDGIHRRLILNLQRRNPKLSDEQAESLIQAHLPDILAEMILVAEQDAKDKVRVAQEYADQDAKDKARLTQEHAEWIVQAPIVPEFKEYPRLRELNNDSAH